MTDQDAIGSCVVSLHCGDCGQDFAAYTAHQLVAVQAHREKCPKPSPSIGELQAELASLRAENATLRATVERCEALADRWENHMPGHPYTNHVGAIMRAALKREP